MAFKLLAKYVRFFFANWFMIVISPASQRSAQRFGHNVITATNEPSCVPSHLHTRIFCNFIGNLCNKWRNGKKISRINENVSDKNMCDTFDTPSKRPLAAFMAAVAVCVSKFFFYSILLCVAQVYSSVCVCFVYLCELCISQPCWFFVLFAFMLFCLLIFIQNAICGCFFCFFIISMLSFQLFGSICVATSVCWLCGC